VRDLTRLELVTEAVRAALEEIARTAGHALGGLAGDEWGRRHSDQDSRQSQAQSTALYRVSFIDRLFHPD
jgi:hypothetical protein